MDTNATVLADAAPGAIASLRGRFHVRQLDLFGSAANDCFDPLRSDVDFLGTFEALPATAYARAYFGLRDALVALGIVFIAVTVFCVERSRRCSD